jgi:translation initiation factor 1
MRLFEGTKFDIPPRCDRCGALEADCQCPPPPPPRIPPSEQTAKIAVEKRKKGKTVTAIRGLPAIGNDLPELLTRLKNACGAGGTLKDDVIEIQGKQVERIRELLLQIGFKVKS